MRNVWSATRGAFREDAHALRSPRGMQKGRGADTDSADRVWRLSAPAQSAPLCSGQALPEDLDRVTTLPEGVHGATALPRPTKIRPISGG
jgi:hypothetical protein